MAWHELLAWVIIAVAVVAAVVWLTKSLICPKSTCANCHKQCPLNRQKDRE